MMMKNGIVIIYSLTATKLIIYDIANASNLNNLEPSIIDCNISSLIHFQPSISSSSSSTEIKYFAAFD